MPAQPLLYSALSLPIFGFGQKSIQTRYSDKSLVWNFLDREATRGHKKTIQEWSGHIKVKITSRNSSKSNNGKEYENINKHDESLKSSRDFRFVTYLAERPLSFIFSLWYSLLSSK